MVYELWVGAAGTVVLWAISGAVAIALGFLLAGASLSGNGTLRYAARAAVNATRGVPTSVLVLVAGMGMMRATTAPNLPGFFPGTPEAFQHVAWGIMLALGAGSAGHLAEIFLAARSTLGQYRLEQMTVLGLSWAARTLLVLRECAAVALPPAGARMVHHLHNTAFAALFPVTDLFGFVQGLSSSTFRVFEFIALGCVVYVALSGAIWLASRALEAAFVPPSARRDVGGALAWS